MEKQIKVKLKKPKFSTPQIQLRKENNDPFKIKNKPAIKNYRQSSFFNRKKSDFCITLQNENISGFLNSVQTPKLKTQTPTYKHKILDSKINFKLPKTSKNYGQKLGSYFSTKNLSYKNIERIENTFKQTKKSINQAKKSTSNKVGNRCIDAIKLQQNFTKKSKGIQINSKSKKNKISLKTKNRVRNNAIMNCENNQNKDINVKSKSKKQNPKISLNEDKFFNIKALNNIDENFYINYTKKITNIFDSYQDQNKFFQSFKDFTDLIQDDNFLYIQRLFRKDSKRGNLVIKKKIFETIIVFTIFYLFIEQKKMECVASVKNIFKYIKRLNKLFLDLLSKNLDNIQQYNKSQAIKEYVKTLNITAENFAIKPVFTKEVQKCLTIIELTFNKIIRKVKPNIRKKIQVLINQNYTNFGSQIEKVFLKFQQIFEKEENFQQISQQMMEEEYMRKEQEGPDFIIQPFKQETVLGPNNSGKVYTLVLDLDETLIHFTEKEYGGQFLLRPYSQEFIKQMAKHYEIVIFTAAVKDYADWIIDRLDENNNISYRLYRCSTTEQNGVFLKDLKKLGRDLSKTIIVDNNPENFLLQPENGIYIKSWYENPNDKALKELSNILSQLVQNNCLDIRNELKQLGQIHNKSFELFNQIVQFLNKYQMEEKNVDMNNWHQNYKAIKEIYEDCQDYLQQQKMSSNIQINQQNFQDLLDKFQEENEKDFENKFNDKGIEYKVDNNKTFYLDENNNVIQFRPISNNPQIQVFQNNKLQNKLINPQQLQQIHLLKSRKKFKQKESFLNQAHLTPNQSVSIKLQQDSETNSLFQQQIKQYSVRKTEEDIQLKKKQKTLAFGKSKLFDGESLDTQLVDKIQDIISDLYKNEKQDQYTSYLLDSQQQFQQSKKNQLQVQCQYLNKPIVPSYQDVSEMSMSFTNVTDKQKENAKSLKNMKSESFTGSYFSRQFCKNYGCSSKDISMNKYKQKGKQMSLKNFNKTLLNKNVSPKCLNLGQSKLRATNSDIINQHSLQNFNGIDLYNNSQNKIGKYKIIKKVGKGAFSQVYKIQDTSTQKIYAAKEIQVDSLQKKYNLKGIDFKKEIQTEIDIIKKVNHPNIIKFKEQITDKKNNNIYIITEFFQGETLNLPNQQSDTRIISNIFYQILESMKYLHEQLLVAHCDLKPENILINNKNHIKIIDFGSSTFLQSIKQTQTQKLKGTKTFWPPEAKLESKIDLTKADVWAFGQTVLCVLTGKLFNSFDENFQEYSQKFQNQKIFKHFQKLLQKCFIADPTQRYNCQQLMRLQIFNNQVSRDLKSLRYLSSNNSSLCNFKKTKNLNEFCNKIKNKNSFYPKINIQIHN